MGNEDSQTLEKLKRDNAGKERVKYGMRSKTGMENVRIKQQDSLVSNTR